jgi:pyrroloquinoline quinone (PQQ) biosynthesis protein C
MRRDPVENAMRGALGRIERHPFLATARRGCLRPEQVQRWIFCAGRESRSFPAILEGLLAKTVIPKVRHVIAENLADENGRGNPDDAHFCHYLKLIREMNIETTQFEEYEEGAGIRVAIDVAAHAARESGEPEAFGYLLINEAMTPLIYGAVEEALSRAGLLPQTEFFRLHVEVDEMHVALLYSALDDLPDEHLTGIEDGIALGERAMALLLDEAVGVFEGSKRRERERSAASRRGKDLAPCGQEATRG